MIDSSPDYIPEICQKTIIVTGETVTINYFSENEKLTTYNMFTWPGYLFDRFDAGLPRTLKWLI